MAWKTKNLNELAQDLDLDANEIREKHRLIGLIKRARKENDLSQSQLAKRLGITQGRVAQIESRMNTHKVTVDNLLFILRSLGYEYKIVARKVA